MLYKAYKMDILLNLGRVKDQSGLYCCYIQRKMENRDGVPHSG